MTESTRAPRPTRAGRIADYLREMFPLHVQAPAGVITFAALYTALQALGGADHLEVSWRAIPGALTVILLTLLLRVYDELKDVDTDLRLGRAGDPRYVDRPIVTGRITPDDLAALRWAITATLFALNVPLGALPLAAFSLLFAVTWLSFHWFFWPAMARNLLLAFATHNPMTLLLVGYVVAIYVQDFGASSLSPYAAQLALGLWLPMAAWEISRKLRAPADETEYPTYSKILGYRAAGALPGALALAGAACLVGVAREAGLSSLYAVAVLVGAGAFALACVRFVRDPRAETAHLRPYAEAFIFVATAGLLAATIAAYAFGAEAPPAPIVAEATGAPAEAAARAASVD